MAADASDLVQVVTIAGTVVTAMVGCCGSTIALVGVIFSGVMAYFMAKISKGQTATADDLKATDTKSAAKMDEIHTAVNGNYGRLESKVDELTKELATSRRRERRPRRKKQSS